ncbi:hypothetical protein JCM16303_002537, partial [Sporobolomyces ruberrimus]
FLFEGEVDGTFRSCLVTGDLRAEPWYLTSLLHNPQLAPYTTRFPSSKGKEKVREDGGPVKELDCIYLDTSNVLLNEELVTKDDAIDDLIEIMKVYPDDTKFFLNTWTWGYEELLKAVYRAFGAEPIHLDWYKHKIYESTPIRNSDPLLATLGSLSPFHETFDDRKLAQPDRSPSLHLISPSSLLDLNKDKKGLRFHACERSWKCDQVWQDGRGCYNWSEEYLEARRGPKENPYAKKLVRPGSGEYLKEDGKVGVRKEGEGEKGGRVVYVNPVEMMKWKWDEYKEITEKKVENARKAWDRGGKRQEKLEFPNSLLVPLARHSTLPELQRFVGIFRPKTLYPLTISTANPREPARDYLSMPALFSPYLAAGGEERLQKEAKEFIKVFLLRRRIVPTSSPDDDDENLEMEVRYLGEGEWEREMRKRGLNIEGGKEIVEEVLKWSVVEEKPVVENGGVRDMETVLDTESPPEPTAAIGEGNRKLTYGRNLSQDTLDSSIPVNAPPSPSLALLPSALPAPVRPSTPAKITSRPSTSNPIGRSLRKSVTFAPSPSKSPDQFYGSSKVVPMKRTRSLPLPPPSPVKVVALPPPPSPPIASTSSLATSSNSENAPPVPVSSPRTAKRRKIDRTEEDKDLKRERLILSLQRTLQGKIGPGGEVIPFTEVEQETLKRRERRYREHDRDEKGKGREGPMIGDEQESPLPREFVTVGSSY